MKKAISLISHYWPLLITSLVLASLLWRDPFSVRTLIPNLEPFPDSFHYISPAKCLIQGEGFHMCLPDQEGRKVSVPPLYSSTMVPFFLIKNDPRMAYFPNLILSFISLYLLYRILDKITKNRFIIFLSLLIFTTTYFIYWFPSLIMAENLLIPIFLAGAHLLQYRPTRSRIILAGIITASMHGSKFAALGLTFGYGWAYLIHIWLNTKDGQRKRDLTIFTVIAGLLFVLLGGSKTLLSVYSFIKSVISPDSVHIAPTENSWNSPDNVWDNLKFYLGFFTGQPVRILWDQRVLLPKIASLFATASLLIGAFTFKYRRISRYLIWLILALLLPILPFYVADGRYAIIILYILIISLGLGLEMIRNKFHWRGKFSQYLFNLTLILLSGVYFLINAQRLRHQLAVNFKYAETPWWYLSVQEMNKYFAENKFETKPYLITLASPYYLDYFGNGAYRSLPLSMWQDFRGSSDLVWGIPVEQELPEIYREKLEEGQLIFATNYGITGHQSFKDEFALMKETFDFTEIQTGCHQQCNLYQLHLPE